HYALNQDGFLFLGNSETIGEFVDLFAAVNRKWKLYQRKGAVSQRPAMIDFPTPPIRGGVTAVLGTRQDEQETELSVRELTEQALLKSFTPDCAIINAQCKVLYFHGRTGKYLEPASGEASLNILHMAREGLRLELTNGIRKVITQKEAVRYEDLQVKTNGETSNVNLIVQPVTEPAALHGLIMVVFEDVTPASGAETTETEDPSTDINQRIAVLEQELRAKEEYLQTAIEELETSNEELKSTNEELQSSNEELQSTNEELETSKEELQSVNEELVTVNTELQIKLDELSRVNNDMNNLLAGTGIGTVFVDHQLCIQRFTPAVTEVINLIQTDVGRPVGHIVSKLDYDHLVQDVQEVLDTLVHKEIEVQTQEGQWFSMHILPYRTVENVIEGAVITFVDITEQKQVQEQLHHLTQSLVEARDFSERIVDTVREPLLVLDTDMRVISANRSFYEHFQVNPKETLGQLLYSLGNQQWDIPELRRLLDEILPERTNLENFEITHDFDTIGRRTIVLSAREIRQKADTQRRILLTMQDITKS
ncbi:MAG: PAS domain-containing protein, partial [Planctomycetota bacterium]